MKKTKKKSELRAELDQQITDFLEHGGKLDQIEQGVSGREKPDAAITTIVFDHNKQERTPLTDVVRELDGRKKHKAPIKRRGRRKKKIIYDDFGEPLRWEWQDD